MYLLGVGMGNLTSSVLCIQVSWCGVFYHDDKLQILALLFDSLYKESSMQ